MRCSSARFGPRGRAWRRRAGRRSSKAWWTCSTTRRRRRSGTARLKGWPADQLVGRPSGAWAGGERGRHGCKLWRCWSGWHGLCCCDVDPGAPGFLLCVRSTQSGTHWRGAAECKSAPRWRRQMSWMEYWPLPQPALSRLALSPREEWNVQRPGPGKPRSDDWGHRNGRRGAQPAGGAI